MLCNDLNDEQKVRSVKQRKEFRNRKAICFSIYEKNYTMLLFQSELHLVASKKKTHLNSILNMRFIFVSQPEVLVLQIKDARAEASKILWHSFMMQNSSASIVVRGKAGGLCQGSKSLV